ncbi:hypothetical protein [Kitasatospora sp. NPDC004531]
MLLGGDAQHTRILAAARATAARLGLPGVDAVVSAYLDCLGVPGVGGAAVVSAVSGSAVPAEISFTGRPGRRPALRLLSEPLEPGGGAVGRCHLGARSLARLLARFGCYREPERAAQAVAGAFPPGGELTRLRWNAAVWLALRTDGERVGVRAYVNLHNRPAGDRYGRAIGILDDLGLPADAAAVRELADLMGLWATPIGLSLDFAEGAVRTARLHFNVRSVASRRLALLLDRTDRSSHTADVVGFLRGFGLEPGGPAEPLLLSVGLDGGAVGSVKCDVSVHGHGRFTTPDLDALERRFGAVPGRRETADLFADPGLLRYVGLTVDARHGPYLNVYYSAPVLPVPQARPRRSAASRGPGAEVLPAEARSTAGVCEGRSHVGAELLVAALSGKASASARSSAVVPVRGGGLAWAGGQWSGRADPTATLSAVGGLAAVPSVEADRGATRDFLRSWLFDSDLPACAAGCQSVLPLYLASRAAVLRQWDGPAAARRLRSAVLDRRRDDGMWGAAGPEALETGLAVLALGALGGAAAGPADARRVARALAEMRYPDGAWCWAPLVCDGHRTWFGHRAATTAVVLRALDRLRPGRRGEA